MRRVVLLAEAAEELEEARGFYEEREAGVGDYCVTSLLADIESLALFKGSAGSMSLATMQRLRLNNFQTGDMPKLVSVEGRNSPMPAHRCGGDNQIVRANHLPGL